MLRTYWRVPSVRAALSVLAVLVVILATLVQSAGAASPARALVEFGVSGPAVDDLGKPGAWDCGRFWQVGDRWGDMTADSDSLGGALPPGGYVATLTAFINSGRYYRLVLYAPQNPDQGRRGGDLIITMPFDDIQREPGYTFPTGRFDPVGDPALYYTPNQLRFNQAIYRGSGSLTDGGRVYANCGINGVPPGSRGPVIDLAEVAPGRWA